MEIKNLLSPDQLVSVDIGELSDGYHSYNELYEHRLALCVGLFNEWAAQNKYETQKSWRHNDGELCFGGGWFIVFANLPTGQISYHYSEEHWDKFKIPEVDKVTQKFDGHSGDDVIQRLKMLY